MTKISSDKAKEKLEKRKEKNSDFYYSIAKITYTVLVVGVIASVIQTPDSFGCFHICAFVVGLAATMFFYMYANKKLK